MVFYHMYDNTIYSTHCIYLDIRLLASCSTSTTIFSPTLRCMGMLAMMHVFFVCVVILL